MDRATWNSTSFEASADFAALAPARLAPKVLSALEGGNAGRLALHDLQDSLLAITIRQAAVQSPHYRKTLSTILAGGSSNLSLDQLPLLNREQLVRAGADVRSTLADYAFSSYTSGTTQAPLIIDRSTQEQKYLAELFGHLARLGPPDNFRLALVVASWHHGRKIEVPGAYQLFPVSLAATPGYQIARELLARPYRVRGGVMRITEIAGPTHRVIQLTSFLLASGVTAKDLSVEKVAVSGQYLDAQSKRLLTEFWSPASIQNSYSLTEIFGSAAFCNECTGFHFDPFLIPEVIDMPSGRPLTSGRGTLALTALYPFTQMTPLIRYLPGDIAEVRRDVCPTSMDSYTFLGRSSTLLDLGESVLASEADILEVLAPIKEVRRWADPAPVPEECKYVASLPVFSIDRRSNSLMVEVSARAESINSELETAVGKQIAVGFAQRFPGLRSCPEVSVVPNGGIDLSWRSRL